MNVSQASCRVERFPCEGCSSEDVSNVMGQDRACRGPGVLGGWASSAWAGGPPGLPFSWEPRAKPLCRGHGRWLALGVPVARVLSSPTAWVGGARGSAAGAPFSVLV